MHHHVALCARSDGAEPGYGPKVPTSFAAIDRARERLCGSPAGSRQWMWAAARLLGLLDEAIQHGEDAQVEDALLDEAIDLATRYLTQPAADDHSDERRTVEIGLGVDLTERYRRRGQPADLDEALRLGQARVAAADSSTWVTDRVNLAARLLLSYDDRDVAEHLDEAIRLLDPALTASGIDEDARATIAANLANAYSNRYDRLREPADLLRAVELFGVAAGGPDPDLVAGVRASLALALLDVHRTGADPDALRRALDEARAATEGSGSAIHRASRWHTLAQVAVAGHDAGRGAGLLDEGSDAAHRALELLPDQAPARGTYLATASAVDFERYLHGRRREALEDAIAGANEGLKLPDLDPHTYAALANQACLALTERFELDGDRADLQRALALGRRALPVVRRADIELALRTNLANAFQRSFELDQDRADLIDGIAAITPAVRRTPKGTERAARLNTAGLLRSSLARATGSLDELGRAIALGREALSLADPVTQELVIYATNTASWLSDRSERNGNQDDLDEAIDLLERALPAVTPGSPLECRAAFTLAGRYAERHERFTAASGTADLQRACDLWDDSLACDEPFISVYAGQRLGNVAFQIEQWAQCEQALAISLDAARRLTERRELIVDRERARLEVQGTGSVAAVAAVRDARPQTAVVHLEQAAATLLADAAERPAEQVTYDDVVRSARTLGGPLVYWAATVIGGIAIVVGTDGSARPVPLTLTTDQATEVLNDLRQGFATRAPDPLPIWEAAVATALRRTWELTVAPVLDILGAPDIVGLIPIGQLAWLPLAAARVGTGVGLLDRCVPRQLPNARMLLEPPPWPRDPQALVVVDPGRGDRFLPSIAAEATAVAARYRRVRMTPEPEHVPTRAGSGRRVLRLNGDPDSAAGTESPDQLLSDLAAADVAHLACHFDLDFDEPSASVLQLGGGIRLGQLVGRRIDGRPHVVLSACDSGLSGTRLPDEALGPAPMLLQAGARSVLAALWPVDDELSVQFMTAYHSRLAAGEEPAAAVVTVQREAIRAADHALMWAAWAHIGP